MGEALFFILAVAVIALAMAIAHSVFVRWWWGD